MVQTRSACEAAPKRCSRPSSDSEKRNGIDGNRAVLDDFVDRKLHVGVDNAQQRLERRRGDQRLQQNFLFGLRRGERIGNCGQRPNDIGDRRQHRRRRSSPSGAGTRSMRNAASSAADRRVSSTRRNQQSDNSATIAPAASNKAMSAAADRVPTRVTRNRALCGTRPNGAVARTRPKRHGRKLAPAKSPECRACLSAISASKPCSAPSSSAG